MKGTENYITPMVRMAYSLGVKIKLFKCTYTVRCCEPYEAYMCMFEDQKNAADEEIAAAEEVVKNKKATDEEKVRAHTTLAAKTFDREQSNLMTHGLPGRNNMKIGRKQTMITRSQHDAICLMSDGLEYQHVKTEAFEIDSQRWYRCGYKEGSYEDHIGRFNVCPYLCGYFGLLENVHAMLLPVLG